MSIFAICVKVLVFPAEHSTDFEVHRHWKALTHTLPLSEWYSDTSSIHTLDYPPAFAYLEYALSHAVRPFDPLIVNISSHDYASVKAKKIMRATVLLTDLPFVFASHHLAETLTISGNSLGYERILALTLLTPGLLLVDNIHFQYNALFISFLFLTLSYLIRHQITRACVSFSLLLNLKHTFLPIVPTVAIYILSISTSNNLFQTVRRLTFPATATISVFIFIWFPFLLRPETLPHIYSRLFPFNRGLLHANWPANFWAIYASLDKFLTLVVDPIRKSDAITTGIIGARVPFAILPNPSPTTCTTLVLVAITYPLIRLARNPTKDNLMCSTVISMLAAFMFGWHVHEKAVLPPLLTLGAYAVSTKRESLIDAFMWLSLAGQFALLELVRYPAESLYYVFHLLTYHILAFGLFISGQLTWKRKLLLAYAVCMPFLEFYAGVLGGHKIMFGDRMPFMPIMSVALFSSAGICASMISLYGYALREGMDAIRTVKDT